MPGGDNETWGRMTPDGGSHASDQGDGTFGSPSPALDASTWSPASAAHPAGEDAPPARLSERRVSTEEADRYLESSVIGQGGMGRVTATVDRFLGRTVARKELQTGPGEPRPDTVERFLREARITSRLEHPNIVPIYEIGRGRDGSLYYTMKNVRGQSLAEAIRSCPTPSERLDLLPHFVDACQAIAYAHSQAVIHRDLKPQNIMVGAFGETLVLDWGIARVLGEAGTFGETRSEDTLQQLHAGMTHKGAIMGTPAYMSPEQARGQLEAIDARSDVWSLGMVLYEIVTGTPPFAGMAASAVLVLLMEGRVDSLLASARGVPPDLLSVVFKAIHPDRDQRYADVSALGADVEAWRTGGLVTAHRYSWPQLAGRLIRRHAVTVGVSALAAGALALAATWMAVEVSSERDIARAAEAVAVEREAIAQSLSRDLAMAYWDAWVASDRERRIVALEAFNETLTPTSDAVESGLRQLLHRREETHARRRDDAIRMFEQVVGSSAHDAAFSHVRFLLADLYWDRDGHNWLRRGMDGTKPDLSKVIATYEQILEDNAAVAPEERYEHLDAVLTRLALADLHAFYADRQGHPERRAAAVAKSRRLLEDYPQSPIAGQARLIVAQAAFDAGDLESAAALSAQILRDPDTFLLPAQLLYGRALVGLQRYQDAVDAFLAMDCDGVICGDSSRGTDLDLKAVGLQTALRALAMETGRDPSAAIAEWMETHGGNLDAATREAVLESANRDLGFLLEVEALVFPVGGAQDLLDRKLGGVLVTVNSGSTSEGTVECPGVTRQALDSWAEVFVPLTNLPATCVVTIDGARGGFGVRAGGVVSCRTSSGVVTCLPHVLE